MKGYAITVMLTSNNIEHCTRPMKSPDLVEPLLLFNRNTDESGAEEIECRRGICRYCGAFGVCNQIGLPFCTCLNGFEPRSPKDWNLNDFSGGCLRKATLQCGDEDGFLQMQVVKQPDYQQSLNFQSADDCKLSCLKECSCNAYALNTSCIVWNGDLFNLQQSPDGDNRRSIQLRLAAYEISSSGGENEVTTAELIDIT
ncbi:G-type lectin S-receptor-like serine/threonine-protein kinase [Thalictrum thalictroides]|uniref:G-type lectin S-receptor-like serine/threonine-protein kinase n=1 Tax=Thalictrum thalictroides TaxID=46969 RepID=A0A7J6WDH3_THATH|nr:G-type lectin S-receptor-like serine/threonine-protein kinase [Thalictrum thalictroides]